MNVEFVKGLSSLLTHVILRFYLQVFRPKVVNVEFVKGLSSLLTHVILRFYLQVFRPKVVNVEFVKGLSSLLTHVKKIEGGDTNIESANGKFI